MIQTENIEKIRLLRLDHAPSNVLNIALLSELRAKIAEAAKDPGVRCLVLASALPKYFSSGLDLAELLSLPPDRRHEPFVNMLAAYKELLSFPKPSVAALNGTAILGGWIVALAADFRVLSSDGKIALSEIRFGLSPTSLLISRMTQLSSSPTLVKEMVLRGRTLRADEALHGGFVDALAEPDQVVAEALATAKSLGKQAPLAYASVKRALWPSSEKLWEMAMAEFRELFSDPQTLEGIEAMRDKRRPKWEN